MVPLLVPAEQLGIVVALRLIFVYYYHSPWIFIVILEKYFEPVDQPRKAFVSSVYRSR